MQQIIHSYKLRLTNLSQGNRSLKLRKPSRRRDIDLKDLGHLENHSPEEILARIIAGKDIRLINRLDPRFEATNLADRRLNNIYREVSTLFEETGTYDLFVGYPFVEGKFIDGTTVRCPVLLFPVRLERNLRSRPRWKLSVIDDEPVVFNKTLFLAYEQFQQTRLKPEFWDEEIESGNDWQQWMNDFYQKLKAYEIEMNFNSRLFEFKLEGFQEYTQEQMEGFRTGTLTFRPNAVLGIFPQSDSALLQDYEAMESNPDGFDLAGYFGQVRVPVEGPPPLRPYIKEEDRFFVTPVDQSQEEALIRIKQGQSLVIHGPPGTGKSQVIVNIIADAMAHGKKVLLVSQKRAALDVVYKRLTALGLGRFAVLVHDYRHDRKDIYRKIRKQIDDVDTFRKEINDLNLTKWEHDYKLLSRQIDQQARQFEELHHALTSRESCGISIHDLYLNTHPGDPPFPLSAIARELDADRLEAFLEKLHEILDYRELLATDHPWADRTSFRHHAYEDRQRIAALLDQLPGQLQSLRAAYQNLDKALGDDVFDESTNQSHIDHYRSLNEMLDTPLIRGDIEALYQDELEPAYVRNKLRQIEEILQKMKGLKLLKTFPWSLYSDLKKHLDNYNALSQKGFRFLSLKYRRAKWFLKKILEEKDLKLTEDTLKALKKEFKLFSRLHGHYSRTYEKAFFQDFPLLDSLKSKREWLEEKEKHMECWKQVRRVNVFPDLGPEFMFGALDREKWSASMQKVETLDAFTKRLRDTSGDWRRYLSSTQCQALIKCIRNENLSKGYVQALRSTFHADYADLKQLDVLQANLSGTEAEALSILSAEVLSKSGNSLHPEAFVGRVRNSIYFYWIEQIERMYPVLEEVSGRGWNRRQEEFMSRLAARRTKVAELINRRLKEKVIGIIQYNRLKNPITYRQIYHQVTKKRRLWSVRKLVKETWKTGLRELTPVWMASPESTSAIFPMEKDFFDIVIFDEASQCFVERAIPVMVRGSQSVIAGDDQQLQPFDMYKVKYEDAESEFVEFEPALEVESILDLAKRTLEESKLTWHYRSHEEELINFSNHAFYEGKLQVMPPASHDPENHPPMEWLSVNGTWAQNRNQEEAERIISLLIELVQRPDQPSIGVVTFNYHQQELIKDLLDSKLEALANEDEDLYQKLLAALTKTEEEAFQGLFIKNIENVQGDERDIIIFSIAYAKNHAGKVVARFGLLNQRGGENRLNVAITRARKKIYVVCSFLPHELQVENSLHAGPKFLRTYLQYVKAVSDERESEAIHLLNLQNEEDITLQSENPIADQLATYLEEKGFHVIRNFGETAYKLDLAVKASQEDDAFLLGIECEGSHYFSGETPKEREAYRPSVLKEKGWELYRVWSRNWYLGKEKELTNILEKLNRRMKP